MLPPHADTIYMRARAKVGAKRHRTRTDRAEKEKGNSYKIRTKLNEENFSRSKFLTPFTVRNMKYILGSNELFVGKGIICALEYIEKRYGIDFAELEEKMKEDEE